MIKVKIKRSLYENKSANSKTELNKIQKANLNFLLLSKFEVGRNPGGDEIADEIESSILDAEMDKTGDFSLYDNPPRSLSAPKILEKFVEKIEPLKYFKITKAITGQSYGKIFKLDNDHILKIFFGGVDVEEDMAWYKKCYDLMHSGEAKLTTLPVYHFGELQEIAPNAFVGYVEMAEVEPLDKFLKNSGRAGSEDNPGKDIVSRLQKYFIEAHFKKGFDDIYEIKHYIYRQIKLYDSPSLYPDRDNDSDEGPNFEGGYYRPLTDEEANGIIEAFYDMVKIGFKLSDVAPRNMGVLKQKKPSDPKIVIFDR